MRPDVAGLRTWWLAALGGWALAVWTATLFGLGGRIGDPATTLEVPALPAVPVADPPRATATDNAEAMARPLFANDRRPHPFVLGDGSEPAAVASVRLTGVLITPGMEMATLTTEQGQSLRLRVGGEAQSGWQLLSLQPRAAVVSGPSGTLNLELQVFSGSGKPEGVPPPGAAPTPQVPPPPLPPPPANAAAEPAAPTAEQIQAIRDRIQARRRQAQQQQAGAPGGQKP
ncbi:hypothetical protein VA603_06935 [Stenotrophomonas sp. MH1]|uniref:General secretion pathway protein N n=1 Tax=Stenotrophomonas capsici TaxID=3110230 RepID=A0ABU5V368_9GAMM|nr:hypothetical protein [Stenotrophomonas sp. MH1]MEA5667268.1 hypothetical protein [Stenotrophomonas sp. MH1]